MRSVNFFPILCRRLAALMVLITALVQLAAFCFHGLDGISFKAFPCEAALGFTMAALALLTEGDERRRWHLVLPSLVFALGAASAFTQFAGVSIGIQGQSLPGGAMATNSAIAFCCIGLTLIIWQKSLRFSVRFVSGCLFIAPVITFGLIILINRAESAGAGYSWSDFTAMPVMTVCLFELMALGLATVLWRDYLFANTNLKILAIPFVVVLFGIATTLVIIQSLYASQARIAATSVERDAFDLARIIQLEFGRDLKLMNRLQARWQGGMPHPIWEQDTSVVLRDNHEIYSAAILSPSLLITKDLTALQSDNMKKSIAQNAGSIYGLKSDSRLMIVGEKENRLIFFILPLSGRGLRDGYLAIAYTMQGLLDNVVNIGWNRPIQISIVGASGELATYPNVTKTANQAAIVRDATITIGSDRWIVRVSESFQGPERGIILLLFYGGIILSLGLAIALYQQARLRLNGLVLQETAHTLRARETELLRLNKELEEFAYVASHDLKAPLRGIDNLAQWVIEDLPVDVPETIRQKCSLMRGRILRLEKILDDILAYSRAGRVVETATDVDTGALVLDIAADLSRADQVYIDTYMPVITTPRTPLLQVFQNLFANAVKHREGKAVSITVSAIDHGSQIEFIVTDNGPGVPKEYHDKIFEMFRMLKPRDQVDGSGLGLSIVKKMVEWQGGRVWASDRMDRENGLAVHFLWPVRSP